MASMRKGMTYALPGWGFSASVFSGHPHLIGLDYHHLGHQPLSILAESLAHQLPQNSHLLGWSLGGLLAIAIAHAQPHKVAQLTLLCSQPCPLAKPHWTGMEPAWVQSWQRELRLNPERAQRHWLKWLQYPETTFRLQPHILTWDHELISQLKNLLALDLRAIYREIALPIHQLLAGKDLVYPCEPHQSRSLNLNTHVTVMPDMGHATLIQQPHTLHQLLET